MEPIGRTLRHVFGRTRFGLYAFPQDGSRPILLSSSATWPPKNIDLIPVVEETDLWQVLPTSRPRSLSKIKKRGPKWPTSGNLALLPVGDPDRRRGGLIIHAGSRSGIWSWTDEDWKVLVDYLDAYLQQEELRREFDSLKGFHEVLLATLPLGVLAIDRMGRVTYLSPPAQEILGYRQEEAVGADCLRVFRPAGVEENPLILGLRGKATRVDLYILDREGKEKPVWMQMARIPGRPGEGPRGLIAMIRDTSEERAFEEDQRRRERLASIGELSAGVAHEIRNPLTGIGNCAQVLRDRLGPDDPRLRFVSIILDETQRLNRIVESLLSFARPGRPQLKESAVVDVVKQVLTLEAERHKEQGITRELKIRGRIPRIFIDPEQITQVLLNVIRNAVEAMPSGGRLTIDCSVLRRRPHLRRGTGRRRSDRIRYDRAAPMKRFVQLRISDTGRGIPPDVVSRVFDPFFTTRTKGTGLGLSISQSIIKEHGGFISMRSIENKGTTVSIDLPVERRDGERRPKP